VGLDGRAVAAIEAALESETDCEAREEMEAVLSSK
jgi:hypothetical protein